MRQRFAVLPTAGGDQATRTHMHAVNISEVIPWSVAPLGTAGDAARPLRRTGDVLPCSRAQLPRPISTSLAHAVCCVLPSRMNNCAG